MRAFFRLIPVAFIVFTLSCNSDANRVTASEPIFDPKTVTKEEFDSTKIDIQNFIQKLNRIIRARNYNDWVTNLSAEYFKKISSKEYLEDLSEKSERLKQSGKKLNSARDYFDYVVVPSRYQDRVDDIEFITHTNVKVYTIPKKGQRLVLYYLEHTRDGWKIIN